MSVKDRFRSMWSTVSNDPAMVVATVQIVLALSDLIVRTIERKKREAQQQP